MDSFVGRVLSLSFRMILDHMCSLNQGEVVWSLNLFGKAKKTLLLLLSL